jgi:isoleucyl-tRNA synthetase
LVLDKDGQKMSKSKQNYVDPNIIFENEGADALRWYLISTNAPWNPTRFYEEAVRETLGKFILTFWNSYNFFTTYAALDGFDPSENMISINERDTLDKWIISRFNKTVAETRKYMENFEIHKAARYIENFIIEDFSNWYLRRSRKRLWIEEATSDKLSAYSSMYDISLGLATLLAPFIPFITEEMYLNLKTDNMPESVHLCDYLKSDKKWIDEDLEIAMNLIREIVEAGRTLRSKIGIKVRYPLNTATLVCSKKVEDSIKDLLALLKEEINVKTICFSRDTSHFITYLAQPIYARIGPRLKDKTKSIMDKIKDLDKNKLYDELIKNKKIIIELNGEKITLIKDDFEIIEQEKTQFARAEIGDIILFLDTKLTTELKSEGFVREIIRRIQSMRKDLDLEVEDRISTEIKIDKEKKKVLQSWSDYIGGETRSHKIVFVEKPSGQLIKKWKIDQIETEIGIRT